MLCAVSNDGSVNAWLYPTERVRSPSPEAQSSTEKESGAEAGETRDDDERKSRAVSPNEATPEDTPKAEGQPDVMTEETKDGEDTPASGEGPATIDTDDKPATQDVEMGEVSSETPAVDIEVPEIKEPTSTGPSGTNGDDIEMTSSQPKLPDSTPPTSSVPPSRQPSPPRTQSTTVEKPKARPLQCVRHSICHSASLLSLSFDDAGR